MCQGLPCLGVKVRLRIDVNDGERIIPANTLCVVREEDLSARELLVEVPSGNVALMIRVSEDDVEVAEER